MAGAAFNFLNGVSCPAVSASIAVGTHRKSLSQTDRGFAERWTATRWKLQSTPEPAGAAVGSYVTSTGRILTFAEHE